MYTNVVGNIWKGKNGKKERKYISKRKKETKHMKDYIIPQKKQQKKTSSKEEVSYSHKG